MPNYEIFTYPLLIKEYHLDTFGHVNNATYLQILEEARWDFLNQRGFTLEKIHATQQGPVVLECHIRFLKEITLRQTITIASQLLSYDKKIGVIQQRILSEDNELCSDAKLTFGFFDLKNRKLILPTQAWLNAIGCA